MAAKAGTDQGASLDEFQEPLLQMANGPDDDESMDPELLQEMMGEIADTAGDAEDGSVTELDNETIETKASEEDEEADADDPEADSGTRANQRIRQLVKEREEMRTYAAQVQEHYQKQAQAYAQQQGQRTQQQMQYLAQQNQQLAQRLEQLSTVRRDEEESNLPVAEAIRRQATRDAEEGALRRAKEHFGGEIGAIKQQLAAEQKQRVQLAAEAKKRDLYERYDRETQVARGEYLFKDSDPNYVKQWGDTMDELVLTYGAAFGLEPAQAAPKLRKFLDAYTQMDIARRAQAGGAKLKKTRQMVAPMGSGRKPAAGNAMPTMSKLQKAGYKNYLEWMRDGEPPVS